MTREQVEKHGEVIKWFCDNTDKGVWVKSTVNIWRHTNRPSWDNAFIYIQNDEYAELRKAQADGKVINCFVPDEKYQQYFYKGVAGRIYYNVKDFSIDGEYFIKPDEPEFKVGDWVTDISSGFTIQAYKDMISKNFRVWTPTEGEWCVFYSNTEYPHYMIAKYNKNMYKSGYYNIQTHSNAISGFKYVAPLEFIQTLK